MLLSLDTRHNIEQVISLLTKHYRQIYNKEYSSSCQAYYWSLWEDSLGHWGTDKGVIKVLQRSFSETTSNVKPTYIYASYRKLLHDQIIDPLPNMRTYVANPSKLQWRNKLLSHISEGQLINCIMHSCQHY